MDNQELPYQEALVRLYQIRDQLELDVAIAAQMGELEPASAAARCGDCRSAIATVRYGRVDLCGTCALARLRVRRRLDIVG